MAEIARRYRSGETQQAVAASLGVSQKVVRRVLDQVGEPLRTSCPVSGTHCQAILDQHADGKTINEISAALGLNFATVYHVLRRAGRVGKKRQ